MRRVSQSRSLLAIAVAAAMSLALVIPVAADLYLAPGDAAQVAYTNGEGVNVRDAPGFGGAIITALGEGVAVTIVEGPVYLDDGTAWFLISSSSANGWVIHDYLASGPVASSGEVVSASSWSASVVNTSGYGLRLRDGASLEAGIMTVMAEGASVAILATDIWDADGMNWTQLHYGGMTGYAATSYLSIHDGQAAAPVAEEPASVAPSGDSGSWHLTVGDRAAVSGTGGGGLNLRSGVGFGNGIITIVGDGNVVTVIDGPYSDDSGNGWYQVDFSSTVGWVHGGYLAWSDSAPTESPGLGSVEAPADEPSGGGGEDVREPEPVAPVSGIGNAIVAEALNYVGTPYVWGGTTPSGWDCSGFTYYIVNKVTGNGMSRSLEVQAVTGSYVGTDRLNSGDLVFFQNTYKWGLSHVGIYIGGSQFVHASSERTGTIISDLWDSYWGPRYYTARRVATD